MFAAKAGAARVIAVECSDFAEIAKRVIEDNKLDHIITVLKEKVEEITALPDGIDEVDIIVSGEFFYQFVEFHTKISFTFRMDGRFTVQRSNAGFRHLRSRQMAQQGEWNYVS